MEWISLNSIIPGIRDVHRIGVFNAFLNDSLTDYGIQTSSKKHPLWNFFDICSFYKIQYLFFCILGKWIFIVLENCPVSWSDIIFFTFQRFTVSKKFNSCKFIWHLYSLSSFMDTYIFLASGKRLAPILSFILSIYRLLTVV